MKHSIRLILTALFYPIYPFIFMLRKFPLSMLFSLRMYLDGVERPYYAYGIYQAALEAKRLGLKRISVLEFGVASGTGLIIMENLSREVEKITGVGISVYGFDIGVGLPEHSDYRDVPYIWRKGFYRMDVPRLKSLLQKTTQLVIGNVAKTVPKFIETAIDPIGFIAFDLDYYSSTRDAFSVFSAKGIKKLPRVFCYFDDIIGTDEEIMCEYVGELLAVSEYNRKHVSQKIARINGLAHKRVVRAAWPDAMYVHHDFTHRLYNTYIYPVSDRQISL